MWCEQCQEDVVPVANKQNSGIQECSQCGKRLSDLDRTGTATTQADQTGDSSIAQTAHALLKRWEANRPIAESSSAAESTTTAKPITNAPPPAAAAAAAAAPKKVVTPKGTSVSPLLKKETVSKKEPEKKWDPPSNPTFTNEDIFDDIPSGLDISEMLPDLIPPAQTASQSLDSSEKQVVGPAEIIKKTKLETGKENRQQTGKTPVTSPPLTSPPLTTPPLTTPPLTSPPLTSPPLTSAIPKVPETTQRKQTQHAGATLASQNDAGSLLKRNPEPIPEQKTKSPSPQIQKQTGAVASPETQSEKPSMFKTKTKAKPQTPAPQPEISQGRVRFTPPEIDDEKKIDDLGIQQAIERHHRKQRNWSVLFAQLMVYGGALAMTCGIAIVIGTRFGSMGIAETTGWLTMAGGHLLFVLGIYTHLSSKMEQVWSEMHARHDELTRLLNQNMTTANPRRINTIAPTSSAASFQRSSLPETIREVA